MIRAYEFTAGGVRWQGNTLPGRRAWSVFKRLSVAILPALGASVKEAMSPVAEDGWDSIKGMDVLALLSQVDLARLGEALGGAAGAIMDQDDDGVLVNDLLSGMRRANPDTAKWEDVSPGMIDRAFSGNLSELLLVLGRVIQENYGDFLPTSTAAPLAVVGAEPAKTPS